jgi:hypothetical protein
MYYIISGCSPVAGCYEPGNDPMCSMKSRTFLDYLSDFQFFENESVPWSWVLAKVNNIQHTFFVSIFSDSYFTCYFLYFIVHLCLQFVFVPLTY